MMTNFTSREDSEEVETDCVVGILITKIDCIIILFIYKCYTRVLQSFDMCMLGTGNHYMCLFMMFDIFVLLLSYYMYGYKKSYI